MVDTKKSEQFKRAASNLGINPEEEDLFISPKYVQMLNGIQKGGMASQEEAMEQMPRDVVMELGEEIASVMEKWFLV